MLDGRVLGGLSREEVRQQQTLKYTEDSRKFAEKQKEVCFEIQIIINISLFYLHLDECEKFIVSRKNRRKEKNDGNAIVTSMLVAD